MDRTSLINKYSRFDTPDIAERIAEKINQYIAYDGIEYLHGREIHGRHTGYLDISSGGFRNVYDFLWPVLYLCRVDCNGVVSADIRKIEKHLDIWRTSINTVPDDELDYIGESDFTEDDDLYAFRSAAYNAELDGFMRLESQSVEEVVAHETAVEEIWNLSSVDDIDCPEKDASDCTYQSDEHETCVDSTFQREYDSDGYPIYTEEEIECYEQAVEDMENKRRFFLNRCREIFYTEGKEALHEYLNDVEAYSAKHARIDCFDDPKYFPDYEIREIRERFDVWDEEKERLRREKMWEEMHKDVDDYWNDPNREQRADWVSPTLVQDLKDCFNESHDKPSFAEFVSLIRRGEFGILPEDYDGLACPGDPGYYGEMQN